MKLPIPNDWNGTDWCRFSICWPDSELWTGLLLGFLSYGTRGRSWDEKTGIVKNAQQVGWEIFRKNYPLEEVILSCKDGTQLAKSNLLLIAALTGTSIDLTGMDSEALDTYLDQPFDFSLTGLANRIGPQVVHSDPNTLQATLERLKLAVEAISDPEQGTDWDTLFAMLIQTIGDAMPIINNYVECGGCGGCGPICGGGGGTGGAGSTPADPSDTQTDPGSQTGPPPEGFPTWEEYNNYKCRAATFIMQQIINDIAALGLIGIAGLTFVELAPLIVITILTPVPFDFVVTIAFLMIQIAFLALSLGTILTFLQDNFNEFVCAMLSGSNVQSSIVEFGQSVDSLMAEDPTINQYGPVAVSYAANFVKAFATIDSFNRMYEEQQVTYPEAECLCSDPGTLLKTALVAPYNVLLVGDDFTEPGDPSVGWVVDLPHGWSFTPQVNTANIRVRFTWLTAANQGFQVGNVAGPWGETILISDGSGLAQEFDFTYAHVLVEDVQVNLIALGQGGNTFQLRKIIVESV